MVGSQDAEAFERCVAGGGVAIFPSDTVYGLACDPDDADAVRRLYALKRRPPDKAAAVMFFSLDAARAALVVPGARTAQAIEALLPGAVTLLLPNPSLAFSLACRDDPTTLGLRVPSLPAAAAALARTGRAVLQSSANLAGHPDARRLDEVPASIREGADLVLEAGELPGIPSTVVDLRDYERSGKWHLVREGAVGAARVREALE
jgi:L-threonylcarbamoyladenylate synthase